LAASHLEEFAQALKFAPVGPCQGVWIAVFKLVDSGFDLVDKPRAEDEMRGVFVYDRCNHVSNLQLLVWPGLDWW
jgi:hypothetical protein